MKVTVASERNCKLKLPVKEDLFVYDGRCAESPLEELWMALLYYNSSCVV